MDAAIFVLSLGLRSNSVDAAQAISRFFATIYEALQTHQLADKHWVKLERQLPWVFPWWDHRARLVRGIAMKFVDNRWPGDLFFKTFRSYEQFQMVINELRVSRTERNYLLDIRKQASDSGSPDQLKIFDRILFGEE